jgi:predicted DNA-binding protein YlxM (UPF0122 family)
MPQNSIVEIDSIPVTEAYQCLTVPIVATLLAKNYSQSRIARTFNKSKQAVNQFIKRNEAELEALKNYDDIMINTIKSNVLKIQQSVDNEDIKKAGLVGKFTSTGIGIEKTRLLEDKSTQNVSVHTVVEDLERRKQELLSKTGATTNHD